ncbi:protein kinase [Psychrobacter sp. BI730]|uniref:protein kinase domain-containing protein n=1 Tax=Psychrobacter sp. BI730 TaxID=2705463 RepID=UPI0015C9D322|nr:protein kinase [Psychrobacter sp. BI730]NYR10258.1 protein kinase [Psychrobacter sp. BI730]
MNFENVEAGNLMKVNDINWILEEQIGTGGNGVVWSASREGSKSEKIAIKFVNCGSKNKNKWKRFEREVTTQSSFEHQSIMSIYDYDKSGTNCWLSMPICNSASRLLNNKNATQICDEYLNIVSAVKYIHNKGMAHRDIKPDNILSLDEKLFLADFGLISTPLRTENRRITKVKDSIGNFATIAPELRYVKDINDDFRPADIYSLGVTLWMFLSKDDNGFDGQYASWAKDKMDIALEDERLELKSLHELLERATENNSNLRPSIEEFEAKLIKWIEATKDFAALISSKWTNLQEELNPYKAHYLVFNDIDAIVSVLNKIVRNDTAVHHCFLPRMGGLDLLKAEVKDNREVRLSMNSGAIYDCLPKALHYINYLYKPSESYFFLETQPIKKPINSESYGNDKVVEYTEFKNGDLTFGEVRNDGIWQGKHIPNEIKSVTRVYEGSFLFVSRHSLYNLFRPTYDGRHSEMGFDKFRSCYPKPYSEVHIKPEPPQFLENDSIWENDPEFYIYLNSLDVPRILLLLEKWPTDEKSDDNEWGIIGSGSLFKFAIDHLSADFSFLEELNRKELLELVSIMYLGSDTHGKRTTLDIWNLHLKHMSKESDEELIRIIRDKSPTSKTYIYEGLRSLGAEQADY